MVVPLHRPKKLNPLREMVVVAGPEATIPTGPSPKPLSSRANVSKLKGFIYEISLSGHDSFTKVNREVPKYVACTIPGTGEFHTAMINM